jgi:hypothetical protein
VWKKNFGQAYIAQLCIGHCKVQLNHFHLDYVDFESTLTKPEGRKLFKAHFSRKLWPWQAYQFLFEYDIDLDGFVHFTYEKTNVIIKGMKEVATNNAMVPKFLNSQ